MKDWLVFIDLLQSSKCQDISYLSTLPFVIACKQQIRDGPDSYENLVVVGDGWWQPIK